MPTLLPPSSSSSFLAASHLSVSALPLVPPPLKLCSPDSAAGRRRGEERQGRAEAGPGDRFLRGGSKGGWGGGCRDRRPGKDFQLVAGNLNPGCERRESPSRRGRSRRLGGGNTTNLPGVTYYYY
eukprot:1375273-Rhodomonas_salina.2